MADAKTKVLPVEPTEDMVVEGLMALVKEICATQPTKGLGGVGGMSVEDAKTVMRFMDVASRMRNGKEVIACYRAMVAAAPQPAASDVPHDVVRDAADNVVIAYGMGWDMDGVIDNLRQALSASEARGCETVADCGFDGPVHDDGMCPICNPESVQPLATPAPSTSTSTSTEEALRAENARLKQVLEPFARVAEHDIGTNEADDDLFRPFHSLNRAPRLTVGHLRTALSALSR